MINSIGVYSVNERGDLLCNGNCNWETCAEYKYICKKCQYVDCARCFIEYVTEYWSQRQNDLPQDSIDPEIKNWDYQRKNTPCRNCGAIQNSKGYYE